MVLRAQFGSACLSKRETLEPVSFGGDSLGTTIPTGISKGTVQISFYRHTGSHEQTARVEAATAEAVLELSFESCYMLIICYML